MSNQLEVMAADLAGCPECEVWQGKHRYVFQSHGERGIVEDIYQCACGVRGLSVGNWPIEEGAIILDPEEEAAQIEALNPPTKAIAKPPIDMSPMATYSDLKDAALAIEILRMRLRPDESVGLAYRVCDAADLAKFAARLRERANEFDTRPEPCKQCGFRHPKGELCGDIA